VGRNGGSCGSKGADPSKGVIWSLKVWTIDQSGNRYSESSKFLIDFRRPA